MPSATSTDLDRTPKASRRDLDLRLSDALGQTADGVHNTLAHSTLSWRPVTGLENGLRETVASIGARYERRSV